MTEAKRQEDLIKRRWTAAEDEVLRALFPRAPREEVLAALPGRAWSSIAGQAHLLRVSRSAEKRGRKVVSPVFVRDGVAGKACTKCLDWKPLDKFARHESCAGGRRNICTTCEGRAAYLANPERIIAETRKYQASHPEAVRRTSREANARRYLRKKEGPGVTLVEYDEIRDRFNGCCAYCGQPGNVFDHVIPLARGGVHAPSNLVFACTPCNGSKHAKTPAEWSAWKERKGAKS